MNQSYWQRKASPWVSYSVLLGGLVSAVILFFLVRVEGNIALLNLTHEEEMYLYLE